MKKSDAIELALKEFKKYIVIESNIKLLRRFGKRVLELYTIPYSKEVLPLNGGKKK